MPAPPLDPRPRRPRRRPDLVALEGYHSPQVDVAVRLNTNESPYPPPGAWAEAVAEEVAGVEWHRYPDRQARRLRGALAELHGVAPEQVYVANGSNEVIQALCLAYGGPGRAAGVFEPTYRLHSHIPSITATSVATGARTAELSLDLDEVRRVVAEVEPALTFLCSPNNPTGMLDPPEAIAEVAATSAGLVVVDEAYAEFSPWSALELVDDDLALVVTRTFSKTWSMAGARLGYLVGPAWVVEDLSAVTLPYHLDAFKQAAGRLALRFEDEMRRRVSAVVAERARLVAGLGTLAVTQWPSAANFVLFRPVDADGSTVWQGLVERGVLVRDCSSWPGLDGCLRVTVGTPEEDDAFLGALGEVLT
ncbi:MAG: histidinol-phosphate transaminase [Actinobacteria bacterium]|nr:histidinol-phosphate transaminase [Actinomycetota bacterium]MBW3641853.1 histidinol-phosphate transaminase [Actinomycetota bacterium]